MVDEPEDLPQEGDVEGGGERAFDKAWNSIVKDKKNPDEKIKPHPGSKKKTKRKTITEAKAPVFPWRKGRKWVNKELKFMNCIEEQSCWCLW